jgi:hypothetical protein
VDKDRTVVGPDGVYGTIDVTCWPSLDEKSEPEVDMKLTDGKHVTLPADVLIEQKDGTFYLPWHEQELAALPRLDKPAPGTDDCWPCQQRNEERLARTQD